MPASKTTSFGEDFGQKVDLTANIRGILRNYPEGTAIIKELVQNADDAGAMKVSICLDSRQHGVSALADAGLAEFQGPALLAYNDSIFTEDDFRSIQRIGDSLKKASEDQTKIGRFGIGFNAVYHWTDLPSFVSANKLVMLDPQARFLPNVNPSNPGRMVDWIENPDVIQAYRDQFSVYQFEGKEIDWTKPFNGTLFRLPLRTSDQAETSSLSKRALGAKDALSILMSLRDEAAAMLLFLNNVESIEISHWQEGEPHPTLHAHCCLHELSQETRKLRGFVKDKRKHADAVQTGQLFTADYALEIFCRLGPDFGNISYMEKWQICNQLGGNEACRIAKLPANELLRLVPWGGLAACISRDDSNSSTSAKDGLAYCFLPLPVRTGLPVMVNGFFELSSNRRDIWQSGSDMTGDGKTRAEWNVSLLEGVISPCYVRLLLRLKKLLGYSAHFQHFWPSNKVGNPWDIVVKCTLSLCRSEKLLKVCSNQLELDAFFSHDDVILDTSCNASLASGNGNGNGNGNGEWIACDQAILLPGCDSYGLSGTQDLRRLALFFVHSGQPLVLCESSLMTTLCTKQIGTLHLPRATCEYVATPKFTRTILAFEEVARKFIANDTLKALSDLLLRYALYGLTVKSPLFDLNALPILPMQDGGVAKMQIYSEMEVSSISSLCSMGYGFTNSITTLSNTNFQLENALEMLSNENVHDAIQPNNSHRHSAVVIVDKEEHELFAGAAKVLLNHTRVGPREREFLAHPLLQQVSNIRNFEPALTIDLMHHVLPSAFFNDNSEVIWIQDLEVTKRDEIAIFMKNFWSYACKKPSVIASIAMKVAIVPIYTHVDVLKSNSVESQNGSMEGMSRQLGYAPLSAMSNIIAGSMADIALPTSVESILMKAGILFIDIEYFNTDLQEFPQVFWDYVHKGTRSGIVTALSPLTRRTASKGTNKHNRLFELTANERKGLRQYLASCESLATISPDEIQTISKFPIFTTFCEGSAVDGGHVGSYFSLEGRDECRTIGKANDISVHLLPLHYIYYENRSDFGLLKSLGVDVVSLSAFYKSEFIPNIAASFSSHSQETEDALIYCLQNINVLAKEDASFPDYLATVQFLPSSQLSQNVKPELLRPDQLFDPTSKEMRELLDDSFFPLPFLQRNDTLAVLQMLGMKQTIGWDGVITCARRLDETQANAIEKNAHNKIGESTQAKDLISIRKRAVSLLRFLDNKIDELLDVNIPKEVKGMLSSFRSFFVAPEAKIMVPVDEYLKELRNISWVPVMAERDHACMPWIDMSDGSRVVASPKRCRLSGDIWLCSSANYILAEPITSPRLTKALGLADSVPLLTIAMQLKHLSEQFLRLQQKSKSESTIDESEASADVKNNTNEFIEDELQESRETISALIPQLYQRLHTGMSTSAGSDSQISITKSIQSTLVDANWIWVGSTFVHPSKVSLTADASPYLYRLPQDLRVYGNLLRAFSVKSSFSSTDYEEVLYLMALETSHAHESTSDARPTTTLKPARALTANKIDLACSIITLLSSDGAVTKKLYIPDDKGCLAFCSDLIYDDVPWLDGQQYASVRQGCRFVHPNISASIAEKVGARSLREFLLSRNIESDSMFEAEDVVESSENVPTVEAFGQAESLTKRIKNIIDMYPDGNPIFSELIQNADDACATSVRIMLDENTYPTEALLSSNMAPLQGPSLLVWNDAIFSESDYKSLARIGHGHKLDKVSTTGRFGLGFNSTYHITDTPTFVSGDHLVIFDPHCSHAPGATLSQPGVKVKCTKNHMYEMFRDQFRPYEFFGCNFKSSYEGTLFRFPFRDANMAQASEISRRAYTTADAAKNLEQLGQHLSDYLLFLRSVRNIEIYTLRRGETVPTLMYRAEANILGKECQHDQTILDIINGHGEKSASRDHFYQSLQSINESELPRVSHRLGIQATTYNKINNGGQQKFLENSEFLVVSGLSGGEARSLACAKSSRHLKLIPFGSVAACLSTSKEGAPEIADNEIICVPPLVGHAFCFLPLPVSTKLPIHVNAYWELSSNRRDIWQGDDTQGDAKLRSDWNIQIMHDILAPLYAYLLRLLVEKSTVGEGVLGGPVLSRHEIMKLFPCQSSNEPWESLAKSTFESIRTMKVFWSLRNNGQAVSLDDAVFIESLEGHQNDVSDAKEKPLEMLESILLAENLNVSRIPSPLIVTLNKLGIGTIVTPSMVRTHFSRLPRELHQHPSLYLKAEDIDLQNIEKAVINTERVKFLLTYCFSDLTSLEYDGLDGLSLLPLHTGDLSSFRKVSPDTEVLYLMNNVEEQLLASHIPELIIRREILSPQVEQCLRDPSFGKIINVHALESKSLMQLLSKFLPTSWFTVSEDVPLQTAENTFIVNADLPLHTAEYSSLFTDEWLQLLWKYIVESDLLEFFRNSSGPPIYPIMSPSSFKQGRYAVRLDPSIPILHMSFRYTSDGVLNCLADLGIFISNPEPLGSYAFNETVSSCTYSSSPHDLLRAFRVSRKLFKDIGRRFFFEWNFKNTLLLKNWVLDEILSKLDKSQISDDDLCAIRDLPIWLCHNMETSEPTFTTIKSERDDECDSDVLWIPPQNIDTRLFGPRYIKLREECPQVDRKCYRLLGVPQQTRGEFYSKQVIPALQGNSDIRYAEILNNVDFVDKVALDILRDLRNLEKDCSGFLELLKDSKIVRAGNGILHKPCDLYDPSVKHLSGVLPPKLFPSHGIFDDSSTLAALRTLGLRTNIDAAGILLTAECIHEDFIELMKNRDPENADKEVILEDLIRRALSLVRYIDNNVDEILGEVDEDGLEQFYRVRDQSESSKVAVDANGKGRDSPVSIGGKWGSQLRDLAWIPVHTSPHVKRAVASLPWPEVLHSVPLAKPLSCARRADTWLVSSSKRISTYDISSSALIALLGWDLQPCGYTCATQILCLSRAWNNLSEEARNAFVEDNTIVVCRLFHFLQVSMDKESKAEIDTWIKLFEHNSVLLVGNQFVEATRISFYGLPGVDTKPFLFEVPALYLPYKALLRVIGVRDSFGAQDLVFVLKHMSDASAVDSTSGARVPLTTKQASIALGILQLLVPLMNGNQYKSEDLKNIKEIDESDQNLEGKLDDPENSGPKKSLGAALDDNNEITHLPEKVYSVDDLRPIYILDSNGYLLSSEELTFNDAPWIREGSAASISNLRFTDERLSWDEARVLGAKSLREQIFTGSEIMCPLAKTTKDILGDDQILDCLVDLVSLADNLGATTYDLTYDTRNHASESLLHPGLHDSQGPALVLVMMTPSSLQSEDILKLLAPPELKHSLKRNSGNANSNPNINNGSGGEEFNVPYPLSGKRLLSTFAVTDCLQIISGDEFYVFDPCGSHLFQGDTQTSSDPTMDRKTSGPRAQRCLLSMRNKFPHQFLPFETLPHICFSERVKTNNSFPGVIIRMPLRTAPSKLSVNVLDEQTLKSSFCSFSDIFQGSLIFSNSLTSGSFSHVGSQVSCLPTYEFKFLLKTPVHVRNHRRELLLDKTWKRQNILSGLFAKYEAPIRKYHVVVERQHMPNSWLYGVSLDKNGSNWSSSDSGEFGDNDNEDSDDNDLSTSHVQKLSESRLRAHAESVANVVAAAEKGAHRHLISAESFSWYIVSTQGAGVLRDVALESAFRKHKLPPFCTLAVKVMSNDELRALNEKPNVGLAYCNGSAVCVTGLPFHIEGPFVQSIGERLVDFGYERNDGGVKYSTSFTNLREEPDQLSVHDLQKWNSSILTTVYNELFLQTMYQLALKCSPPSLGFYKYWPFTSVMTDDVKNITCKSSIDKQLHTEKLFLTRTGFGALQDVILTINHTSNDSLLYLQTFLPIALCPMQVSATFDELGVKYIGLTPHKLRRSLARDSQTHCLRLRSRYNLIAELLNLCLSDIQNHYNDVKAGIVTLHDNSIYQDLSGVPLLPMSDGSLITFPSALRNKVCFAPPVLHVILPALREKFIHPAALKKFSMFDDAEFQEAIFLPNISSKILKNYMHLFLPISWHHCKAVGWEPASSIGHKDAFAEEDSKQPPETLLFSLWNDVLSKESQRDLDSLGDWPLVPVVSLGRSLLISPKYLGTLIIDHTVKAFDASARKQFHHELECLTDELPLMTQFSDFANIEKITESTPCDEDWGWARISTKDKLVPRISIESFGHDNVQFSSNNSKSVPQQVNDLDPVASSASLPNEMINNDDVTGEQEIVLPLPGSVQSSNAQGLDGINGPAAGPTHAADELQDLTLRNDRIRVIELLKRLGIPFLDGRIFENVPVAIEEKSTIPFQQQLLNLLYTFSGGATGNFISQEFPSPAVSSSMSPNGTINESPEPVPQNSFHPEPLVDFSRLSADERIALLEFITPRGNVDSGMQSEAINRIRALPLFTDQRSGQPLSIDKRFSNGVFWCDDNEVLHVIPSLFKTLNEPVHQYNEQTEVQSIPEYSSSSAPTILVKNTRLSALYNIIGVRELDISTAVKEFTLPALSTLPGVEKVSFMMHLSKKWDILCQKQELVTLLKKIAWLPLWDPCGQECVPIASAPKLGENERISAYNRKEYAHRNSSTVVDVDSTSPQLSMCSYTDNPHSDSLLRLPAQLVSWQNDDLMSVLAGNSIQKYVCPPWLRSEVIHTMLIDLGMSSDIDKKILLAVAHDIEADSKHDGVKLKRDASGGSEDCAGRVIDLFSECRQRARRLLRYVQANDRAVSLFDSDTGRKLCGIKFIPVEFPISVSSGAHIDYQDCFASFNSTISSEAGSLGFSSLPVLEKDISPHQIFFSSLGITARPNMETVLKHLFNITGDGRGLSLDRWNTSRFSIKTTFESIFSFLEDNLESIPPNVLAKLEKINWIPIGSNLFCSDRLYFRLSEDLSPFMHEVPRIYGQHEKLFKKVGVREFPSARDYQGFLHALFEDCHNHALNANELRATIAIIESIAEECAETENNLFDEVVYIPDENSILRNSKQCLFNDNASIRARVGSSLTSVANYHLLHPFISAEVSRALGAKYISTVVTESLNDALPTQISDSLLERRGSRLCESLLSAEVLRVISSLITVAHEKEYRITANSSFKQNTDGEAALLSLMAALSIIIVRGMQTKLTVELAGKRIVLNDTLADICSFVVQESGNDTDKVSAKTIIYVNEDMIVAPISFEIAVSFSLCKLLGIDSSFATALGTILSGEQNSARQVLTTLQMDVDTRTLVERQRGVPGERLCQIDEELLELKPFRLFRIGEIVAYCPEVLNTSVESNIAETVSNHSFKYARVLTIFTEDTTSNETTDFDMMNHVGLRRVSIKISRDVVITVLASHVYSFKSIREALDDDGQHAAATGITQEGVVGGSLNQLGNLPPPPPVSNIQNKDSGGGNTHKSTQLDVFEAIDSLLMRAGIPRNMDRRALESRIVELEADSQRTNGELSRERHELTETRSHLEVMHETFKCKICLTNDFDHAMVPCGHTLCAACVEQLRGTRGVFECPFCRRSVATALKLFLPETEE